MYQQWDSNIYTEVQESVKETFFFDLQRCSPLLPVGTRAELSAKALPSMMRRALCAC